MEPALSNLSLQQIQIFLTVAEACNFSKAGETLHLTQPAISKCISTLERALGCPLFVRTTREVHITPVGQALYNNWKHALWICEEGYRDAQKALRHEQKSLHIGIPNTGNHDLYFWPRQEEFARQHPTFLWDIQSEAFERLYEELLNGTYDMVFLPDFFLDMLKKDGLLWAIAAEAPIEIIVPDVSPLFTRELLTLEDLSGMGFIGLSDPHFRQRFCALFQGCKTPPVVRKVFRNASEVENTYRPNDGLLAQTDAFFRFHTTDRFRRIPLKGQTARIYCAWQPTMSKKAALAFIRSLSAGTPARV